MMNDNKKKSDSNYASYIYVIWYWLYIYSQYKYL